ncbi:MAG TPA: amino acid adenylation domain-containing protein, partial [Thermoanaerobaculia bacterium]|nr:amino acid adenylation domain-containing protein [Thermoanaerobaculia bacterium]
LERGPLFRPYLLRLSAEDHVVLASMHHIVSDGWSLSILVRELVALYEAFRAGQASPLPELPVQYADYAVWQRRWLAGDVLEAELAWWRQRLAGLPALLELPTDRPRPPVQTYAGDGRPVLIGRETSEALAGLALASGATLFMALLAVFQGLLGRYAGQTGLAVGSPMAGRGRSELEPLIGFFVNTLVLPAELAGRPGFRELLERTRRRTLEAYAHQEVPFERLVEELAPERSLAYPPLFQVMFVLQNTPREDLRLPGLRLTSMGWGETRTAKFDLTLSLTETGEGLAGTLEYNTDLFDGTTIDRMAVHLERLIAAALAEPETPLAALSFLSAPESHQLTAEWNDTAISTPAGLPVHLLFESQAARTPDAPAVSFAGEVLTYRELDLRADTLSSRLRELGAGPESRVALFLERSADLLTGILAVWKAGASWVPLDPSQPDTRLALVLEDAFRNQPAPLLIIHHSLRHRALPLSNAQTLFLDTTGRGADGGAGRPAQATGSVGAGEGGAHTKEPSTAAPPRHPQGGDLAYVLYTSGTSGRPKGVMVEHGSLAHFVRSILLTFDFHPGDRVPCVAPFTFDAFLLDVLPPLLTGGTAVIFDTRPPLDLPGLLDELESATHFDCVPALMRQIVDGLRRRGASPTRLRWALMGGDAVPTDLLQAVRDVFPASRPTAVYGPTEATVVASFHFLGSSRWEDGRTLLGRPLPDALLELRNQEGHPVPIGVAGEVWLGGPGAARGYQNLPDLTAAAWTVIDGRRWYRTGDLARRLPDGTVEFLGRVDQQVKVRGFRVEPGEIEAVLAGVPGVGDVAVLALQDPAAPGEPRLVACVVPRSPEAGDLVGSLVEQARRRLPEYMVPADWLVLPSFPVTPHGKLDRRALLALASAAGRTVAETPYEPPRTSTEELLADLWSQLLGRDGTGRRDHFFDLGGHSLLAARLASRISDLFGMDLPLRLVFEAPRLEELARRIDATRAEEAGPPAPPVVPVPRDRRLPLSFAQERLWFLDQLDPGQAVYNMPLAVRLAGGADPAVLAASLGELCRRHEALRTSFPSVEGAPYQAIAPAAPFVLPVIDLRGLPPDRAVREALSRLGEVAARPFDLRRGPLLRTLAILESGGDLLLSLDLHHTVADGWSMGLLQGELVTLYGAVSRGVPSPLPELPVQYADYAVWQRSWLSGEVLERQVAYWRRQLAGAPALLELPTDRPRPPVQSFRGGSLPLVLSPELTRSLQTVGRRRGATLFMTLLAAFQSLLHRASGQEVVPVGTPVANRGRTEVEGLIGLFVNTLVLATDLTGDPPFGELLARVRETSLEGQAHQELPFEKLVEVLAPERSLGHAPLFQVMLTFQNLPAPAAPTPLAGEGALPSLALQPVETSLGLAKFDLSLTLEEMEGGLAGSLSYAADLFDRTTAVRLAQQLEALLAAVAARPETRPSELLLLSPAQRQQLLHEWSGAVRTERGAVSGRCLHQSVEAQVERTPDAVAVRFGADSLTYQELDGQANRLARLLRRAGVGAEVPVAVFMDRSLEMVVALLGVLKAGGFYVPLDPAYPPERLAFMLEDCQARVLLSQDWLMERLPDTGVSRQIYLDPTFESLEDEDATRPEPLTVPAHLAYLIYTSGSTGRPKGVAITHASAAALVDWAVDAFGEEELAGTLASTSICFDLSVFELFVPLSRGGCVLVVETVLDLLENGGKIGGQPITLINTVPSAAAELVRSGLPASVRTVNLAGEPIPPLLVGQIHAQAGVERLLNLYGPSEDTTYSTTEETAADAIVPPAIGRPIEGTRAYVLDGTLHPVSPGLPGELYLTGAGLARGYFRRPDLTAE